MARQNRVAQTLRLVQGSLLAIVCCVSTIGWAADPSTNLQSSGDLARRAVEDAARQALASMPGTTGFVFAEITEDGPIERFGVNSNQRFAVGSTFKLFILGTLVEQINAGQRLAEDVAHLRAAWVGPPNSELAGWPLGSPVTLHTLALKMISISDNTATDHLLFILGRKEIERQMAVMGHAHPAWNTPLLSTREMTLLRNKAMGLPAREYQSLNLAAKRAFLENHCAGPADYAALDFDTSAFELAEWYCTPLDMSHALAWIERETVTGQPAAEIRAILAVDPKLDHNPGDWPFVGFKGGSEDRLLAGNWLLQHRRGTWYTLHVFCNSPAQDITTEQFVPVVNHIFQAIESTLD